MSINDGLSFSYLILYLKGSLGAVVKLSPCDQEVTGSSCGNSLLQNLQGKAA
jgi:hypothetical protein